MMADLLPILLTGAVSGLVTWGGLRVELRYLRRDVDKAHTRIDRMQGIPA
ncbi:hypothetical protein [uncultured Aquitalea sp.]|nr:hypothetical protein [uncultured Aquitalea sp.]